MRKDDDEFKREAVKKIHDGQSVASVARELGVAESPLHNWKRQAVEVSSDSKREVLALRKKLGEMEMERDILKGGAYLRQERVVRYRFITGDLFRAGVVPSDACLGERVSRLPTRPELRVKPTESRAR